jgi:hypothetical protein
MIVPKIYSKFWKKHYQRGDMNAIAAVLKKSPQTISAAMNKEKATVELIQGINRFYRLRAESLQTK